MLEVDQPIRGVQHGKRIAVTVPGEGPVKSSVLAQGRIKIIYGDDESKDRLKVGDRGIFFLRKLKGSWFTANGKQTSKDKVTFVYGGARVSYFPRKSNTLYNSIVPDEQPYTIDAVQKKAQEFEPTYREIAEMWRLSTTRKPGDFRKAHDIIIKVNNQYRHLKPSNLVAY